MGSEAHRQAGAQHLRRLRGRGRGQQPDDPLEPAVALRRAGPAGDQRRAALPAGRGARLILGVLYTGRDGDGYHNRVGGLDGFVRFNRGHPVGAGPALRHPLSGRDRARLRAAGRRLQGGRASPRAISTTPGTGSGSSPGGPRPRVPGRQRLHPARGHPRRAGQPPAPVLGRQGRRYTQINIGISGRRTKDHTGQLTDERRSFYANVSGPSSPSSR